MNADMLGAALSTYWKVADLVGALAIAIFTMRLSLLSVTVGGAQDFADAFKSLIAFFIALALSPFVFKAIIMTSAHIAEELAKLCELKTMRLEDTEVYRETMNAVGNMSMLIRFFTSTIPYSVGYIAQSVYSLLLGALCAATPIVLLYFELSNSTQSLRAVAASALILSSWPILWNILALLAHEMWPPFSHTTIATMVFWSVVKLLQLLSPLFTVVFFKSF